jgi:prepilin-type N-terminal cleavage/methylation domain-containing protein
MAQREAQRNRRRQRSVAFTLIELLVVVAIIVVLAGLLLPALAKAKAKARGIVCLSNVKQLGCAWQMYSHDHDDFVPEEGDISQQIDHPVNRDAWYNQAIAFASQPSLVSLYHQNNPPLPATRSIWSCPAAAAPKAPPSLARACFMYGENARLCIDKDTRASQHIPNVKLNLVPMPSDTILVAEVDANAGSWKALSVVAGQYAIGRHEKRGVFAMCDGSGRVAKTNEFLRTPNESNNAGVEWMRPRTMYWFPTRNTPD